MKPTRNHGNSILACPLRPFALPLHEINEDETERNEQEYPAKFSQQRNCQRIFTSRRRCDGDMRKLVKAHAGPNSVFSWQQRYYRPQRITDSKHGTQHGDDADADCSVFILRFDNWCNRSIALLRKLRFQPPQAMIYLCLPLTILLIGQSR